MKEAVSSRWVEMALFTKIIVVVSAALACVGVVLGLFGMAGGAQTGAMAGLVLIVIGVMAVGGCFMNVDAKRKRQMHNQNQQGGRR